MGWTGWLEVFSYLFMRLCDTQPTECGLQVHTVIPGYQSEGYRHSHLGDVIWVLKCVAQILITGKCFTD